MYDSKKFNFESVREWSSNGKHPFNCYIGVAWVKIGTRRNARRAIIDVDLIPGGHDLSEAAGNALQEEYREYARKAAPRRGTISELSSHFHKASILFDVRAKDAGEWFTKVMNVLNDPANLVKLPSPFEQVG